MLDQSDPHRFRKGIAGLCMIGAPVLFLLGSIIAPGFDTDEAGIVSLVTGDPDAWLISMLAVLAGWALLLGAVLGLMHMLRERGAAEGHVGGAFAIVGILGAVANGAVGLVVWQMATGDPAQMTALLERLTGSAGSYVPLFLLQFGVTIGVVVLSWALFRLHFAPAWMAAAIGAGGILFAVATIVASQELYIAASVVLLAGLGALGRVVLRESVEDWEHTPEFRGMRPVAGH